MEGRYFGTLPDGRKAELYTLESSFAQVDISNFGATIVAVRLPDRNGIWEDVALGFDTPAEYLERGGCHGATIGRYAGRIANARFVLNGKTVQVAQNRGNHMIHGGTVGFHRRLWEVCRADSSCLELKMVSEDGDQGFPGTLTVFAVFSLEKDVLTLEFRANTDADTPFNMTNHVYWNLAGHGSGTVDEHILQVPAEECLETDAENIPTGKFLSLIGTELDLRQPIKMETVHADHSFLLKYDGGMHSAGRVYEPESGRWLEVSTDWPCVQVYTADTMKPMPGKGGAVYGPRGGMCLEAQACPDAPNHENFPSAILRSGECLSRKICWKFGVEA